MIARKTAFAGYDLDVMTSVKLVDASTTPSSSTFEFTITAAYSNLNHVMHGGAAGVIFDMCTTSALGPCSKPGYWDFLGGVTRSLNLSYLKAVPVGTRVRIESTVVQAGRTMAMIRGRMVSLDGKTVYCTCEHHKVAVPSKGEYLTEEFETEWDRRWKGKEVKGKL
jgi:acyl-coenzyme A thioesterase 13